MEYLHYPITKLISIVALNFIVYWRTLGYSFVSDDIAPSQMMVSPSRYKDKKGNLYHIRNGWHKMWLQFIGSVYWKPMHAHLMTLTLHTINCILIYLMLHKVTGNESVAYLAAILFAINPVNTQGGAIWLSGKIYSFSTTLSLFMFVLPWAAPGFFYLMKYFSVNGLFTPLSFIFTPYWYFAVFPFVGVFFYKKILKFKIKEGTNEEMRTVKLIKIIPFTKAIGYYTFLCLFPWRIALYHTFLWGVGVNPLYNRESYKINRAFWLGLIITVSLLYLIVTNWGNPLGFGLFWFLSNIVMWCNLITLQQQISERTVYTANIGMMCALASLIHMYPVAIAVFITGYIVRLWFVMPMYTNEYWHTEYSCIEAKSCNYVWICKGMKKFHLKDYVGAYYDFLEAKNCIPWEFKANFNAANMAVVMQNFAMADRLLLDAEKCPYEDQEVKMWVMINKTRDWIKECVETKNIDMNKIYMVR